MPSPSFGRRLRAFALAAAPLLFLAACPGGPEPLPEAPVGFEAGPGTEAPPSETAPFDAASVPEELRQDALLRVKLLVEELNGIIRRKDYDAWLTRLSDEYIAHFSTPAVLEELSKAKTLQRQGLVLTKLLDYFLYVVYPSRQYDRVDDIEFVAADRVKAITVTPTGERLVLYELAKYGDTWKISIGRQP